MPMASVTGLKKEADGNNAVKMPQARYPNKIYSRLRPNVSEFDLRECPSGSLSSWRLLLRQLHPGNWAWVRRDFVVEKSVEKLIFNSPSQLAEKASKMMAIQILVERKGLNALIHPFITSVHDVLRQSQQDL